MKKRILYIINFIRNGGPSRVVLNIINNINKDNEISLLTIFNKNNPEIVEELKKKGINVITLDLKKTPKSLTEIMKETPKIIGKINPDIIHSHGVLSDLLNLKFNKDGKKVTTVHCNIFEDYSFTYGRIKGILYAKFHLCLLNKFDKVIACSSSVRDALKNKIKNITFVRNGVDVPIIKNNREELRKKFEIPQDAKVYIYVGRLSKRKNILTLLENFKNYNKDSYLLVFGRGELEEECKKYNSEKIKILGFKENVLEYFPIADIYVSASKSEGLSIAIIEALDKGLHMFLSDIPSHKEVLSIDKNIYLGEIFDENNFGEKMKLIEQKYNDENKKNIVEFKNKYLSSEAMAKKYLLKYEEE